jgi:hypothetical protein
MPPFADRIRGADNQVAEGEAAVTIADRAIPRAGLSATEDARELIEVLGLEDATWTWDTARASRVILERARHGREFSANDARMWLPRRAAAHIAGAFQALILTGLAAVTDGVCISTSPGARGSLIRRYTLTLAGERLASELAPMPGETFPERLEEAS